MFGGSDFSFPEGKSAALYDYLGSGPQHSPAVINDGYPSLEILALKRDLLSKRRVQWLKQCCKQPCCCGSREGLHEDPTHLISLFTF